jgi:hypothetical protein
VPEDPPAWSIDLIGYVSLIGGLVELGVGITLLIADRIRKKRA